MRISRPTLQKQRGAASWTWQVWLLASLALLAGSKAEAQSGGKAADLLEAARNAVNDRQVDKTPLGGFTQAKTPFSETPRSGILVGFDVGLGKHIDHEAVFALRPIYLTPEGIYSTKDYGSFVEGGWGKNKGKIIRTKQIKAKPGFAVGAIRIKKEQGIRALALECMRMDGAVLDPSDTYTSPWAGDSRGGEEVTLSGQGAPIVGIHGNLDDDRVLGLGLQFIRNAPVKHKPTDKATAAADKSADTSTASQERADEAGTESSTTVEVEDGDEPVTEASTPLWIPIVTFAAVALPIFLIMLAMFSRKTPTRLPAVPVGPDPYAVAAPVYPGVAPGWHASPYAMDEARAAAWKSCYMGAIGLVAWCLPIAGVPVNIIGIKAGLKGLQSDNAIFAVLGLIMSSIGLLLSAVNAILGAMMATGNLKM